MFSQGWAWGGEGIEEQGHASPNETPSICVLEAGQILARPSVRTLHRVGIVMVGTEEVWVVGWASR